MGARASALLIALCLTGAAGGAQQTGATDHHFYSTALAREMPYRVIMPASAGSGSGRFPVLYLLHGLTGHFTDWTERTQIASHVANTNLIIVMPEGADSWYVNWHAGTNERWENYLAHDLVAEIDARFPTDARRDSRFIAGLSMGGYGALRMGLKHPDQYALAASLSGALDVTRRETYGSTGEMRAAFARTFGPVGSARRSEDDVIQLAGRVDVAGLPFFYVDCGAGDPFLPSNREMAAALQARAIPYEYRETPGRHNWAYWDRQIVEVLRVITARQAPR